MAPRWLDCRVATLLAMTTEATAPRSDTGQTVIAKRGNPCIELSLRSAAIHASSCHCERSAAIHALPNCLNCPSNKDYCNQKRATVDSQFRSVIRQKIIDAQAAALPVLTRRDVGLPAVKGKATAIIGMRRSGKTSLLWQILADRHHVGADRAGLLYFSFEPYRA